MKSNSGSPAFSPEFSGLPFPAPLATFQGSRIKKFWEVVVELKNKYSQIHKVREVNKSN
ncbi:hypothetical protein ES708_03762 [subsurface metagenome]|jgi:hypothetical protein